jgi:hypothetical protein
VPGVDPHYNNGTTSEATSWGAAQAAKTLRAMGSLKVTYKIVWLDIELPGIKPALDNGWNNVYTSPCSGRIASRGVAPSLAGPRSLMNPPLPDPPPLDPPPGDARAADRVWWRAAHSPAGGWDDTSEEWLRSLRGPAIPQPPPHSAE